MNVAALLVLSILVLPVKLGIGWLAWRSVGRGTTGCLAVGAILLQVLAVIGAVFQLTQTYPDALKALLIFIIVATVLVSAWGHSAGESKAEAIREAEADRLEREVADAEEAERREEAARQHSEAAARKRRTEAARAQEERRKFRKVLKAQRAAQGASGENAEEKAVNATLACPTCGEECAPYARFCAWGHRVQDDDATSEPEAPKRKKAQRVKAKKAAEPTVLAERKAPTRQAQSASDRSGDGPKELTPSNTLLWVVLGACALVFVGVWAVSGTTTARPTTGPVRSPAESPPPEPSGPQPVPDSETGYYTQDLESQIASRWPKTTIERGATNASCHSVELERIDSFTWQGKLVGTVQEGSVAVTINCFLSARVESLNGQVHYSWENRADKPCISTAGRVLNNRYIPTTGYW
jgi:hypothetical protein